LKESLAVALKVMSKTMDSTTLSSDKLEFSTLTRNKNGKVVYHVLTSEEIDQLLKEKEETDAKEKKTNEESK
jgi:20S proteasome subunit alpha 3